MSNVSADLIWEVVRSQNAFLEKRKTGGGIQFSRDPMNLVNKHSRKHAGFVNNKAIGVQAGEKGAVVVTSKKADAANKPASQLSSVAHSGNKNARSTYKAVANRTAKSGYRPDLRQAAVARASAIRKSQRTPKAEPEKKLRGNAAKKAAE
ncbi:ribosomal protein L28e [Gaeumannomyces tritici R3-111a-1]|uniref:Ribosomal protein L28e n=1 Tax=Gaeumannomyces tritici (strain R3-111a-1) TaxID=644352 RepID=J3NKC9_GAET3|nr:ribosomal protein L28e [Gaeumannomyces tritici R3-111a-1]EJT81733.1 ribosomal protein L28e [Gaeumannomyces tritici R3-111a-1]